MSRDFTEPSAHRHHDPDTLRQLAVPTDRQLSVNRDLTEANDTRRYEPDTLTQIEGLEALRSASFSDARAGGPAGARLPEPRSFRGPGYRDPRPDGLGQEAYTLPSTPGPRRPEPQTTKHTGRGGLADGNHHSAQSPRDELLVPTADVSFRRPHASPAEFADRPHLGENRRYTVPPSMPTQSPPRSLQVRGPLASGLPYEHQALSCGSEGQNQRPPLNLGPSTSVQLAGLQALVLLEDREERHGSPVQKKARPWDFLRPGIRPLLLILAIQAVLSARLLWANTAFQDEALYLWAGHLELAHWSSGTPIPDFSTYFSGAPVVYPPLAALADSIGGLAGARLLSLIFMLGSTTLLFYTARRLYNRRVAIMASAFFGTLGWADQLGAFATYDAMAVFLTALSAWQVVRARGRLSEPLLIGAGITLAFADAAKYAAVLWNPIVVGLVVLTATEGGWLRKLSRATRLVVYSGSVVYMALKLGGHGYMQGLDFTTLHRQIVTGTPPLKVLDITWGWLALLVLMAFLGIFLSWYDQGRPNALPVLLFLAGILAPVAQAHESDITSLHKHVVFGAWFLCIMTGYAASKISYLDNKLSHGVLISLVVLLAGMISGCLEVNAYSGQWPNVSRTMPALASAIRTAHCPCLVFQEDPAHYYLSSGLLSGEVVGPYSFTFHDSHTWETIRGAQAMAAAIADEYFGVVEIDASQGDAEYHLITGALRSSGQYILTSSVPWPEHPGEPTEVWQLTDGNGG